MLNNINKTDLFYDYYAQWITVYIPSGFHAYQRY